MKKAVVVFVILILFVLDWLALDDITTDKQPSLFGEYAILIISAIIIAKKIRFFKYGK